MPLVLLTALVMSPAAAKKQAIRAKNGAACGGNMRGLLLSRCLCCGDIVPRYRFNLTVQSQKSHTRFRAKIDFLNLKI